MAKESSFFEKLKRGMGTEVYQEKREEEKKQQAETPKQNSGRKKKPKKIEMEVKNIEEKGTKKTKKKKEKAVVKKEELKPPKLKKEWLEPEGQLAIDVYQTETELIIRSAIAGIQPEKLDISVEQDVITIKGNREKPSGEEGDYFTQECYWGPFSREIILPVEVNPNQIKASMKEGILIIRIPKILREKKRKVEVKELD